MEGLPGKVENKCNPRFAYIRDIPLKLIDAFIVTASIDNAPYLRVNIFYPDFVRGKSGENAGL